MKTDIYRLTCCHLTVGSVQCFYERSPLRDSMLGNDFGTSMILIWLLIACLVYAHEMKLDKEIKPNAL